MTQAAPRLLYIDDDEALCHLARRRLSREGYEVTIAGNGRDGVALARDQAFDVVALDHYMPGQDGLETLGQLMGLPSPPTVIFVTGSDETHIAVSALKAGAVDYVIKSVGEDFFDLLGRTIEQALAARRLTIEKEQVEQRLRETNQQLEAMLNEMNHRVANSLQMVSAVVSLQARMAKGDEAKAMLTDIRQRIHAVGRVHRQLYVGGTASTIVMDSYIDGLAQDLADSFSSAGAPRSVTVSADPLELPVSMAVAMGILVNELVSNACKYAYGEHASGQVRVMLRGVRADDVELAVEDDGEGYDAGETPRGTGLGSQIMHIMAETLGGALSMEKLAPGFRVSFTRRPG
ncbi:MAG: response regulator [Sphingomonadales bacterium]|nr:response regulator [Sphingomonadales bacterium]MDE2169158.1 response regulator [Sphingomonadales bacterium]